MLGAFLTSIIANGMTLLKVSLYWEQVVLGIVVLSAVLVDFLRKRPVARLPRYLAIRRRA